MYQAYGDNKFEDARINSHKFQDALTILLKELNKNNLSEFTIKYGVF